MPATTDPAGLASAFYDSVRAGDIPAATAVFADDLVWFEPPFPGHPGGTFAGKANVLQNVLGVFLSTWTGLSVLPERVTSSGDIVVVHGRYSGRHRATGRAFEARFVHTWFFRGTQAVRFEMLADTVQLFRAVADIPA